MNIRKKSKAYLSEDILSYNYKVYGKKDTEVTIITEEFDPVFIVEDRLGKRFPVIKTKIYERSETILKGDS